MDFKGRLRVAGDSEEGIPVDLRLDDIYLELRSDGEELGVWRLDVVQVTRANGNRFDLSLGSEALVFEAMDPLGFAYDGVAYVEEVSGKLRKKRRTFKRKDDDSPAAPTPLTDAVQNGSATKAHRPQVEQISGADRVKPATSGDKIGLGRTQDQPVVKRVAPTERPPVVPAPVAETAAPGPSSKKGTTPAESKPRPPVRFSQKTDVPTPIPAEKPMVVIEEVSAFSWAADVVVEPLPVVPAPAAAESAPAKPAVEPVAVAAPEIVDAPEAIVEVTESASEPEVDVVHVPDAEVDMAEVALEPEPVETFVEAEPMIEVPPATETQPQPVAEVSETPTELEVAVAAESVASDTSGFDDVEELEAVGANEVLVPDIEVDHPESVVDPVAPIGVDETNSEPQRRSLVFGRGAPEPVTLGGPSEVIARRFIDETESKSESEPEEGATDDSQSRERGRHANSSRRGRMSRRRKVGDHDHQYDVAKTVGGITRRVCMHCGHVSFDSEDVYQGWS